MQLSEVLTPSADVVTREVGGELVLLDLESGQYFGLDPIGGRVWEALSTTSLSLASLVDVIEQEFDAPRERIEADLIALAGTLEQNGLVTRAAA